MRAAFGLVGILIVIGVIVWIMGGSGGTLDHTKQVLDTGRKADEQVRQVAGIAKDGLRVNETITLEPQIEGGKLSYVLVTDIVADGPMATHFGLKKNDSIIEVNEMKIRELSNGDPELAKSMILEAYQRKQPITVVRGGSNVKLPQAGTSAAAPAAPASPATPSQPKQSSDPLQRQLDAIQGTRMP